MATIEPQQEIFQSEQYFWCHEGNEHIQSWLSTNAQDFPDIYATYINDANPVIHRKRVGNSKERDQRMLMFLQQYPMTYINVIDEFIWYKAYVLQGEDLEAIGPHQGGLINVFTYSMFHHSVHTVTDRDPQILAQARDLLYKQVFDFDTRHQHWVWRGEKGLLNSNEVEPLSKKQKSREKSQRRWAKRDAQEAEMKAAGITDADIDPAIFAMGPHGENSNKYVARLMLDLKVSKEEGGQRKAENDNQVE
ncbi:hypothetical protein KCU81_g7802, partial [Aureobasidium melanogenum]|uniref:Uncharacterized protein n=1 Tax=Aureobasidium melanogenum (strain CBS 110374) TaxID=1043003 RepID=A0A074VCI6_AURM1